MKTKNLKIRSRLQIGFAAIFFMVLVLGMASLYESDKIWEGTSELYQHPFAVNMAIREIETDIARMHHNLEDVVLSKTHEERKVFINNIERYEQSATSNIDLIYKQYLGQKSSVDSLNMNFRHWLVIRDSINIYAAAGNKDAAYRDILEAEIHIENVLLPSVLVLKQFSMNKAALFYTTAETKKNDLQIQLIIIISGILILSFIAFYSVLSGINDPVRELISVTNKYSQGDYSERSNNTSTNEIGILARSVNDMAQNIETEMNIKRKVIAISDAIIGSEELLLFGKSLISVLLSKTGSDIGAIYFLDESTSKFEPYFSIGMKGDNLRSFSSDNFEGEFGRSLLEKEMVRITDIPSDSSFDFAFVAGNFKPKEIINIPVLHRDRVVAIISLASLKSYSEDNLEVLRISEKNITTAVNSILAFEKVREISTNLNLQVIELEKQSQEMKLQTEELHEQNAELDLQKQQINEANRLKSEFLSSMSHELRTPLNSVIALTGVLNRRLVNKIPVEEFSYLDVIERNGKHLLALINDILDLSRIEAGKSDIQLSEFSFNEMVNPILTTLQPFFSQKKIKAINLIGNDSPLVTSDMAKCHHILQNLIGNAVKFTNKGSVEISSVISGNEIHISVKDTGIGIPEDQIPFIFDEFRQVDGSASRKHEGTGLGLAIADKYSRLIGGRLEVRSIFGEGSVFTLVLPLKISEELKQNTQLELNNIQQASNSINLSEITENGAGKTILIIEDSEPAIIQLVEIIKEQSYSILIAHSGPEALELVKTNKPDGIILDLMMPGMDGFEVLEKIRSDMSLKKIPVLILTAKYLDKNDLKRLSENNIHQLIQKGDINRKDLLTSINRMHLKKMQQNIKSKNAIIKPVKKGEKPVILLVEDNPDNVTAAKALIDGRYDLIVANDGQEGVLQAKKFVPDVILMDISLPVLDGFKVLDEIRKDDRLIHIPVIAVTASVMKGNREEMLAYGFDDYIAKPIDNIIFEEKLRKYL